MSQIMKAFLGVFMILLMVVSTAGILGAFLTVLEAQNLHAAIVSELEDSDFASAVIRESFEEAKEAGLDLSMVLYESDNSLIECRSSEQVPGDCSSVSMAMVKLGFDYKIAFFKIDSRHVISGYAR